MVKILIEFTYESEMASGSGSGVYQDLLFGLELSSRGMGGRFKYRLPQSTVKWLLGEY